MSDLVREELARHHRARHLVIPQEAIETVLEQRLFLPPYFRPFLDKRGAWAFWLVETT
jgi:hypothetical protein